MEITLRPIKKEDLELRVKWFSDPEVIKYLGSSIRHSESIQELQEKWLKEYFENDRKRHFVILADDNPIGLIGLNDIDLNDKNAGLFITIGEKDYWGKGIGAKALELIKAYAFDKLDLHKIYLSVYAANAGAIRLYEKCGYVHDGRLKDHVRIDDTWCDEVLMSLFNPSE